MDTLLTFGFAAATIIKEGRVSKEDVDYISEWCINQALPKITEEQTVLFLLSSQNNLEAAKSTIKAFYSIRNDNPNIFTGRLVDSKEFEGILQTVEMFTTLDDRTENGLSIMFSRLRDTNYRHFDLTQWIKLGFMTLDATNYDNPSNGVIGMFDMKGTSFLHLTCVAPKLILTSFKYIQEALPAHIVAVHVLNANYLVSAVMKIIKPFLNADFAKKIHFHSPNVDMDWFFEKLVSKNLVSEEYGGNLPPVKQLYDKTIQKLVLMKNHFEAEEKQRRNFVTQKLNN